MTSEYREFEEVKTYHLLGGPDRKRNESLKLCSYDLIAFFDDDIEATTDCVYEMATKLEDDTVGMVFGKTLNMEFRDRFDEAGSFLTWTGFLWARGDRQKDIGQFETCEPVLAGKSASCMIKRSIFVEIGRFDINYEILGEETDLAWRVWLSGSTVLYVPKSVAYHAFNTRFKPIDFYVPKRVYYNGCRNYLSMLYTNLGKKNWIVPVMIQTCAWSFAAFCMVITGRIRSAYWIVRGLFYFYSNMREIWNKRLYVQRNLRKVRDEKLFPIILKNPPLSYYLKRLVSYVRTGLHG